MTHLPVAPRFWMNQEVGLLHFALLAYVDGEPLRADQIGLLRAYFAEWADGDFHGVDDLRERIKTLATREDVDSWLEAAMDLGIDPL